MQNSGEIRKFLESVLSDLRPLRQLADRKRNTLKIRCCETTLRMLEMRARSTIEYIQSGGDIAPLKIQEEIYRPVLDYWANILGMDDEDI